MDHHASNSPKTNENQDPDLASLTRFQRVSELGRWALHGRPPMSPDCRSARAVREKKLSKAQTVGKDRIWTTADVELSKCVSARELVAGFRAGTLWPMPLRQLGKELCLPVGVKWKLRGNRLLLCGWIAAAMTVLDGEGLIATHGELAQLLELEDASWVAELVRDLRAWRLVKQDSTHVQHGLASSRRGNVYRLTKIGAYVFGLDERLAVDRLPDPDLEVAPRRARTGVRSTEYTDHARAHAPGLSPNHPEITTDEVNTADVVLSTAGPTAILIEGPISLPSSVASLHDSERSSGALNVSTDESQPASSVESCDAGRRLYKAEKVEASRSLGELVDRVVPNERTDGARSTPRRSDRSVPEQERVQRERDIRRQGQLREQVERREEAERAKRRRELEDAPAAPAPVDGWAEVARAALEQERRDELARYKRELEEAAASKATLNRPRPRPGVTDELETLETLERSCTLRGMPLPTPLAARLYALRNGGTS